MIQILKLKSLNISKIHQIFICRAKNYQSEMHCVTKKDVIVQIVSNEILHIESFCI